MDAVPRMAFGWLCLVLAAHHPDGKGVIGQLQPVERAGEVHLLHLLGKAVEVSTEVAGRQADTDKGQHNGQQSGTGALADL